MMMLSAVDSSKKKRKKGGGGTGGAVSTPPPPSFSLLGTRSNKQKKEDEMQMMLWTPPTTTPPSFLSSKTTNRKWMYPLLEESGCGGIFHPVHKNEETKDDACDKNFLFGGNEEEEEGCHPILATAAADSNRKKKKDDETLMMMMMMMEGDMGGGEGYNKDDVSLYGDDSHGLGILESKANDGTDETLMMMAKATDEDMKDCNNHDDDDVSLCGGGDDEASWMTTMKLPTTPTRNNTAASWPVLAPPSAPVKTKRYSSLQPYYSPSGCSYNVQATNNDGYCEDQFLLDSPLVGDNLRGRYYVDDIIITDDDHDSHRPASLQGTTSKKTMISTSNINKHTTAVSPDHHHCHHHEDASNGIDGHLSKNKPGVSTDDDDRDCHPLASSEGTTSKKMMIRNNNNNNNNNNKDAPAVSPDHHNHHDDGGDTKLDSQDDSSNKSAVSTDSHHLASSDDDDTCIKNTTIDSSNNKRTVSTDHDDVASFDEFGNTNLVDSNKTNVSTTDDGRDDGRYLGFTSDDDTPKKATRSVPPDEHLDHLHVGDCTTTILLASQDKGNVSSDDDHGGTTKNTKINKDLQEDMTSPSLLSSAASSSAVDVGDANANAASNKRNVSSHDHGGTPTKIMVKDQQEDMTLSEEKESVPSYAVDADADANAHGAKTAHRPTVTNMHEKMHIFNSNQSRKIPVSPIQHNKMKASSIDILHSSFTSNKANVSTDDDDHHHGGTTSKINKIKDSQEDTTLSSAPSFTFDDTNTNSPTAAAAATAAVKTITIHSSRKIPVSPIQHDKMKKTFNSSTSSSSSSSSTFLFPNSTSPVVVSKKTKKRNVDVVVDPVSATKQTVKKDRPANSRAAAATAAATHTSNLQQPLLLVPGLPLMPEHTKQEVDLVRKQEVPPTPPLLSSSWGSSIATNNRPGSFHGPPTSASSLPLPASLSSFQPRRRFNEGGLNSNMLFKQQMLSSWGYGHHHHQQQQQMIIGPACIGGNACINNTNNYVMTTDATKQVEASTAMMMMDPCAAATVQYPFRGDHSTHQKDVRSCAMMTMMQGQQGPSTSDGYGIPSQHEKREEKRSVCAPNTPVRSKDRTPMIMTSLETKPKKGGTKKKMGNKRFQNDQTGIWTERFYDAVKFVHDHGHCKIPCQHSENQLLATWAKRQRYQFVLFKRELVRISTTSKTATAGTADYYGSTSEKGGRMQGSTLTWERIHALNSIGFCWDTRELAWSQHYEELKDIMRKFKSPRGGNGIKEYRYELNKHINKTNPKLRTWIKCQHHQYKKFTNGSNSHMTAKRLELLFAIGFSSRI